MVLPPYKGGIFRGAFGSTFRRIVCATRTKECSNCLILNQCLYKALFEPQAPPHHPNALKFRHAPAPYVLNPPLTNRQVFRPGDTLDFELVLIGRALDALPYFIYTFMDLGNRGLGRERGRYELSGVDVVRNGEVISIYDGATKMLRSYAPGANPVTSPTDENCPRVTLEFLTPLRLKEKGDLVTKLTFPLFFERLAERLNLLAVLYANNGEACDFAPLMRQAQKITVDEDKLHWYDWGRYSARQKSAMKLGGMRGKITFTGNLSPFMPYLRLGTEVNAGQGTSFGLGRHISSYEM
jgi:CRISPR-associated endoribonuclease Cas6